MAPRFVGDRAMAHLECGAWASKRAMVGAKGSVSFGGQSYREQGFSELWRARLQ